MFRFFKCVLSFFTIFGKRNNFEHRSESVEYLINRVQTNAIHHILYHGAEHRILTARLCGLVQIFGKIQSRLGHLIVRIARIGDQILVVRVLHKYLSTGHRYRIIGKVVDHRLRFLALLKLEKSLTLATQVEHIRDTAKYEAKLYDLDLGDLLRYVAYVYDLGGLGALRFGFFCFGLRQIRVAVCVDR